MNIDKEISYRSARAIRCLSFNSQFYIDVKKNGLMATTVFKKKAKYFSSKNIWFQGPNEIESDFQWLITLGILRREVDGQGLTSKVRLTPMGREIIETRPELFRKKPYLLERLANCIFRKLVLR